MTAVALVSIGIGFIGIGEVFPNDGFKDKGLVGFVLDYIAISIK